MTSRLHGRSWQSRRLRWQLAATLVLPSLLHSTTASEAVSLPIPASVLRTWTSAGTPLLHIQPALHHSSTSSSLVGFKSVVLADSSNDTAFAIDGELLSDPVAFRQDIAGVQIANLELPAGEAILTFARDKQQEVGGMVADADEDTGDMWAMTFPALCSTVSNASLADYKLWRTNPGREQWQPLDLEIHQHNLSIWFPTGRYLGKGFAGVSGQRSLATDNVRLYSFGGECASELHFSGNADNNSFSADVWRFENGPTESAAGVSIAIPRNPPIPEAGFSVTQLSSSPVNSSGTNNVTSLGADRMLVLGGYTSKSRFVGLGQLAIYSIETEGWSFVSATVKQAGVTPRAGHSAVMDESGDRVVLFGGWVGNITRPAEPQILSLKIGDLDGVWEWEGLNTTEETPGAGPPSDLALWGHAATLLEGNVMLITSGFAVTDFDKDGIQSVNERTYFLNLTSNTWVSEYRYPVEILAKAAAEEARQRDRREIGILAGVFGGVIVLVILLALLFCYARRKAEYADLRNDTSSTTERAKFHSLDLEYGRDIIVDGIPPFTAPKPLLRDGRDGNSNAAERSLLDGIRGSPELPPRPVAPPPLRTHHRDLPYLGMERIPPLREEQQQHSSLAPPGTPDKRRSIRSEMVAWVREWANADAAAQAVDGTRQTHDNGSIVGQAQQQQHQNQNQHQYQHQNQTQQQRQHQHQHQHQQQQQQRLLLTVDHNHHHSRHRLGKQPSPTADETRCITSSSVYSEGQVSTLTASEIYDTTPVSEVPYPVPPILLSTAPEGGNEEESAPRHPRVLVSGPRGVTTPLPKRMAVEFPVPTVVPRDSLTLSSPARSGCAYQPYRYSSVQPSAQQSQTRPKINGVADSWRDVTPPSGTDDDSETPFYTIPLTALEGSNALRKTSKTLGERVREEMYSPGPARTDDDCRVSSIMDYYAESSKSPPPIEPSSEDEDEDERANWGKEDRPFLDTGERARTAPATTRAADELPTIPPISVRPAERESVVTPLLSETIGESSNNAAARNDNNRLTVNSTRSRIPSIGSSIRRRAAAMAATLSPSHSSSFSSTYGKQTASTSSTPSFGRKNVLLRRPQTANAEATQRPSASTMVTVAPEPIKPLQPQRAEIVNADTEQTGELLFINRRRYQPGADDSSVDARMDDKVVQLVYTAPRGKLRVVNPSERRVSSSGTEASGRALPMHAHRRVSSTGRVGGMYGVISSGEGIPRLGSAAARRIGEMD
ncbi:hypothetical protein DRE_04890 [Drechslerella stenobrocha 248]|uniref:Uncharacterized protein n=1 Tax=Drechslerella stenobrocha 248 TaxID=1043628 RepID=W7I0X2_9PEZI|nr:hypothetical protein DRE_04890 [Drechslerella stenobrocha 248]